MKFSIGMKMACCLVMLLIGMIIGFVTTPVTICGIQSKSHHHHYNYNKNNDKNIKDDNVVSKRRKSKLIEYTLTFLMIVIANSCMVSLVVDIDWSIPTIAGSFLVGYFAIWLYWIFVVLRIVNEVSATFPIPKLLIPLLQNRLTLKQIGMLVRGKVIEPHTLIPIDIETENVGSNYSSMYSNDVDIGNDG